MLFLLRFLLPLELLPDCFPRSQRSHEILFEVSAIFALAMGRFDIGGSHEVLVFSGFRLEHVGQSKNSEGPRSKRGVKNRCYVCVGREQAQGGQS